MSKRNKKDVAAGVQDAAAKVGAIAQSLALADGLAPQARATVRGRNKRVPDAVVELLANLAEQSGGSVAGIPFDAAAARDALAHTKAARALMTAGRALARRVEDDALQRRGTVADEAMGIYVALERLVRTPKGRDLRTAYDGLRAAMRAPQRRGRKAAAQSAGAKAPNPQPAKGA